MELGIDRRRLTLLAAVWLLPSLILAGITWSTYAHYRISESPRLSEQARRAAMEPLRASLEGQTVGKASHPELEHSLPSRGPIVVSVWSDGSMKARLTVHGETIAAAIDTASAKLGDHTNIRALSADARRQARIKVDIFRGRGPLLRKGDLLADATQALASGLSGDEKRGKKRGKNTGLSLAHIGMQPGADGLGVSLGGLGDDTEREVVLLPDELMRGRLLMAEQPLEFVPEFKLGLNFKVANQALAGLSGLEKGVYANANRSYWRFRSDAFVERPHGTRDRGAPLQLTRNMPPRPELSAANLRAAAIAGGHYLVKHQAENGRYIYEQNLSNGTASDPSKPGAYSIPRHAGVTYFLAELFRITKEEFLRVPIERAFAHLQDLLDKGGCEGTLPSGAEFGCVIDHIPALDKRISSIAKRLETATGADKDKLAARLRKVQSYKTAGLGSTALAVVALAEYKRATDSEKYMPLTRKLAEWILYMQRDDGSFRHLYVVPTGERVESETLLYYSGEAALALARMYTVTGEERYLDAAKRGLDWLVDWYDFFVGGFIYGEEHWTCIAAEAIYPGVKREKYRSFCAGYAQFLRRQQFGLGDFPGQSDLAGAYGVSPFVMPYNTPAGSRSEAMISAYLLGSYHGKPDRAIRSQVLAAVHYLLGQQITEDSAWDVNRRANGLGAIPGGPTDRVIRIDYVQHVSSALIRSIGVLEGG